MSSPQRLLLSGNQAIALAAKHAGVHLGVGYPGTPSTEVLEEFAGFGGKAQWAPNEKVALEVGIGAAFAGGRSLVTMKHVGVNVAADPLFTAAYTGVSGALVLLAADDPGMASSQNEQDTRRYARAAGIPCLEPADSQEAYDFLAEAIAISEKFQTIVILRVTTRICHSKTVVNTRELPQPDAEPSFERDIPTRVMIPAYARIAHKKLRAKLADIAEFNETSPLNTITQGNDGGKLGIIASGISCEHAAEAAPDAALCKISLTYPLPLKKLRSFAESVDRCVVIEEGDPCLTEELLAVGIKVEGKDQMYRFGELNVTRVKRIISGDLSEEPVPPRGKPPQLCVGCPHRIAFEALRDLQCTVTGDIGCYTLGVLPPFEAMDTCVCMGASIGVGLGMRHVLPDDQARRVVSVIGDSTFMHSGVTGLIDMVYNRPPTGHVVLILDNNTTAMTGLQEHPGTGRLLDHSPAHQINFEELCRSLGIDDVTLVDPAKMAAGFKDLLAEKLDNTNVSVIIARHPCLLAVGKIKQYEKEAQQGDCK